MCKRERYFSGSRIHENDTPKNNEKVKLWRPKESKMTPKSIPNGPWKHTFPELVKPWFCETLKWFYMVFVPPGVQESTENRKEIAPGEHMPKKCQNLGAESNKHENGRYFSGATRGREFILFDPEAFWLHFWSPSRFKTSFGCQDDEKMDPQGGPGTPK